MRSHRFAAEKSRGIIVLLATILVVSACGSRLTTRQLLSDARGGLTASGSSVSGPSGGATSGGATAGGATAGGATAGGATAGGATAPGATSGTTALAGGAVGAGGVTPNGAAISTPGKSASCSTPLPPIVIGSVGESSGVIGATVQFGPMTVQAWAASVNATGGIACHQIKYIHLDDGGDPSQSQADVQQLVEQDHAIALVQTNAVTTLQADQTYLTQKQIPVIGSEGVCTCMYTSPMFFPQDTSGTYSGAAPWTEMGNIAKGTGKTKVALITCVESSACTQVYDAAPSYAPQNGLALVYRTQASITAPDYTSQCEGALSAGAQQVLVLLDTNSLERVGRSCTSLSYHPQYLISGAEIRYDLASDSDLDGIIGTGPVMPWTVGSNPTVARYLSVLHQYAPGLQPGIDSMMGWVSAMVFQLAAQRAPQPLTSASLLNGLWSIQNADFGGVTMPVTYSRGQNAHPIDCWFIVQAKSAQWSSPNNGSRQCS